MWRIHDNGLVCLYCKFNTTGVPVDTDVYDPSFQDSIMSVYKPVATGTRTQNQRC